jgi:anti-sigma B factor antagonist
MGFSVKQSQGKSIITIDNEKLIGIENETIHKLVSDSIENGSKNITINLSKVEYISSWGIGLLVHAYTTCHNKNVQFNIEGVNAQVVNVLSQLKLTEIFNII